MTSKGKPSEEKGVEERQAEMFIKEKTDEYLSRKWELTVKIAKFVLPILLVLAGFLGYKQYVLIDHINDLQDKLDKANKLVEQAQSNVAKSDSLTAKAEASVEKGLEVTQRGIKLAEETNKGIFDSQSKLFDMQERLYAKVTEVSSIAASASRTKEEVERIGASVIGKLSDINGKYEDIKEKHGQVVKNYDEINTKHLEVEKTVGEVNNKSGAVDTQYRDLIERGGGLKKLEEVNSQLLQAIASETVVLRAHQPSYAIRLPDLHDKKAGRFYEIVFETQGIGKQSDIVWKIKTPDGQWQEPETKTIYAQPKGRKAQNQQLPIAGTGYILEVEFVNHDLFSNDFIILKIKADPKAI
jgi:hypothetical protein